MVHSKDHIEVKLDTPQAPIKIRNHQKHDTSLSGTVTRTGNLHHYSLGIKNMIELRANATKAKNDIPIEAVAICVKSSFPQFETQSSTLVAAEDDADINR
ncbi:hypothetical protein Tco_1410639 [Tanacetum coccineum]